MSAADDLFIDVVKSALFGVFGVEIEVLRPDATDAERSEFFARKYGAKVAALSCGVCGKSIGKDDDHSTDEDGGDAACSGCLPLPAVAT